MLLCYAPKGDERALREERGVTHPWIDGALRALAELGPPSRHQRFFRQRGKVGDPVHVKVQAILFSLVDDPQLILL